MPPFSTRVDEEGVLIDNLLLVENGRFREAETSSAAAARRYPSRNPASNLADLRAQIAANAKGVAELHRMVGALRRWTSCTPTWATCRTTPRRRCAGSSPRCATAQFAYELDNGAVIKVAVRVDAGDRSAEIDFTGTSPQLAGQLQRAVRVAMAAVLYVFRTLVDDDIPLNAGCLQPLTRDHPAGHDASPAYPAAVVGGQRGDLAGRHRALYAALGVMAEGSGHDEQLHVRQRAVPVLRDDRRRLRRRATASTAPTWCRPT